MSSFIDDPVVCSFEKWEKLSPLQQQFLREAEAGHFCYLAENGEVVAWGAGHTGNLFSMEVVEEPRRGESVYLLQL